MSKDETACVYASLILADDDIAVTVSFFWRQPEPGISVRDAQANPIKNNLKSTGFHLGGKVKKYANTVWAKVDLEVVQDARDTEPEAPLHFDTICIV